MSTRMKRRIAGLAFFFSISIGAAACAVDSPTEVKPDAESGPCYWVDGRWLCM